MALSGAACADEEESGAETSDGAITAERTATERTTPSSFEVELRYTNGLVYADQKSRRRFNKLPPASPSDTEGFARRLLAVGRLHHRFADEVARLEPPPRAARAHRVFLAAARRQGDAYRATGRLGLVDTASEKTIRGLRERLDKARAADRASARARRALAEHIR